MKKESFQKLVLTGVFAALSYVVFTFLQIKIPAATQQASISAMPSVFSAR